jgi:TIR domain/Caspase domain
VTDIFISYAREDRDVAGRIAEALTERGFKVWWDWELIGGDNYRFKIREVIGQAKKSIVLWSRHSIMSAFVIDEASEAKKHGKLIPVSIDGSDPPFGFGDLHTIALDAPRIDVEALVAALEGKAPPREQDLRKARRGFGLPKIAAVAAACLVAAVGAYWSWSRTQATLTQEPVRQAEKPATPQAFTSRIALVIGNRAYKELPVIENAVRDADLVSAELQRRGFKVIKQLDLTAEEMTRAFKDFETLLSVVGGVGVFYYAGSAVYIDGEDILLPIDATAEAQNRRIRNSVNVTQLAHLALARGTPLFPLGESGLDGLSRSCERGRALEDARRSFPTCRA